MRTARRAIGLWLLALGGCHRVPPVGAGEPERPARAMRRFVELASGAMVDERALIALARGVRRSRASIDAIAGRDQRMVVSDLVTCTVTMLSASNTLWRWAIPECSDFLVAAVARDSTTYVRTRGLLAHLGVEGEERWRLALDDREAHAGIARPAALPDSRVAAALSSHEIVVVATDGRESGHLNLPDAERLAQPPVPGAEDGVVLLTNAATYFVSSQAIVRRQPLARAETRP